MPPEISPESPPSAAPAAIPQGPNIAPAAPPEMALLNASEISDASGVPIMLVRTACPSPPNEDENICPTWPMTRPFAMFLRLRLSLEEAPLPPPPVSLNVPLRTVSRYSL